MDIVNKLTQWQLTQAQLKEVKAQEMKLRKEICAHLLKGAIGTFTKTFDIAEFGKVKVGSKLNYKLDEATYDSIRSELSEEELLCVNYRPSLNVSAYRKLAAEGNALILVEAISSSPAAPTLEIK